VAITTADIAAKSKAAQYGATRKKVSRQPGRRAAGPSRKDSPAIGRTSSRVRSRSVRWPKPRGRRRWSAAA